MSGGFMLVGMQLTGYLLAKFYEKYIYNSNQTNRALIKATVIGVSSSSVSSVIYFTCWYDIDPTGVGKKLGLTVFNRRESPAKTSTDDQTSGVCSSR